MIGAKVDLRDYSRVLTIAVLAFECLRLNIGDGPPVPHRAHGSPKSQACYNTCHPRSPPYTFAFKRIAVALTAPGNSLSHTASSPIAGSVLPLAEAERQLRTLPGVIDVRIEPSETGAVNEVHVVTTMEVSPKATVRNVETMLKASFRMQVDHRKISVATSNERIRDRVETPAVSVPVAPSPAPPAAPAPLKNPRLYFEDVEIQRSRAKGVMVRVTLRKGDQSYVGECEGPESARSRAELAARGALLAIAQVERGANAFVIEGCKVIEAFDREFMFVGISARVGRETALLTGSCEIKDSPETASVLAVLDATNRWVGRV
jgi:hypothetical protein